MSISPIQVTVEVDSTVKLVRPEVGTIKLSIRATDKFKALEEDEQREQLDILKQEQRFRYCNDGEIAFCDPYLEQYFTIVKLDERWEYAGGECNILETHYSSDAKRV